jgi:uncharacterized protein (TIGR02996 family)
MSNPQPSDLAFEITTVLDDNLHVPLTEVLQFERALVENPADAVTRQVYRDWLLEHGCERRAGQLVAQIEHEPEVYRGQVRPQTPPYDWAGL